MNTSRVDMRSRSTSASRWELRSKREGRLNSRCPSPPRIELRSRSQAPRGVVSRTQPYREARGKSAAPGQSRGLTPPSRILRSTSRAPPGCKRQRGWSPPKRMLERESPATGKAMCFVSPRRGAQGKSHVRRERTKPSRSRQSSRGSSAIARSGSMSSARRLPGSSPTSSDEQLPPRQRSQIISLVQRPRRLSRGCRDSRFRSPSSRWLRSESQARLRSGGERRPVQDHNSSSPYGQHRWRRRIRRSPQRTMWCRTRDTRSRSRDPPRSLRTLSQAPNKSQASPSKQLQGKMMAPSIQASLIVKDDCTSRVIRDDQFFTRRGSTSVEVYSSKLWPHWLRSAFRVVLKASQHCQRCAGSGYKIKASSDSAMLFRVCTCCKNLEGLSRVGLIGTAIWSSRVWRGALRVFVVDKDGSDVPVAKAFRDGPASCYRYFLVSIDDGMTSKDNVRVVVGAMAGAVRDYLGKRACTWCWHCLSHGVPRMRDSSHDPVSCRYRLCWCWRCEGGTPYPKLLFQHGLYKFPAVHLVHCAGPENCSSTKDLSVAQLPEKSVPLRDVQVLDSLHDVALKSTAFTVGEDQGEGGRENRPNAVHASGSAEVKNLGLVTDVISCHMPGGRLQSSRETRKNPDPVATPALGQPRCYSIKPETSDTDTGRPSVIVQNLSAPPVSIHLETKDNEPSTCENHDTRVEVPFRDLMSHIVERQLLRFDQRFSEVYTKSSSVLVTRPSVIVGCSTSVEVYPEQPSAKRNSACPKQADGTLAVAPHPTETRVVPSEQDDEHHSTSFRSRPIETRDYVNPLGTCDVVEGPLGTSSADGHWTSNCSKTDESPSWTEDINGCHTQSAADEPLGLCDDGDKQSTTSCADKPPSAVCVKMKRRSRTPANHHAIVDRPKRRCRSSAALSSEYIDDIPFGRDGYGRGVSACKACRVHGVFAPRRGHKGHCPFTNCTCSFCTTRDSLSSTPYAKPRTISPWWYSPWDEFCKKSMSTRLPADLVTEEVGAVAPLDSPTIPIQVKEEIIDVSHDCLWCGQTFFDETQAYAHALAHAE